MQIIDAFWEKRNLGVSCQEIHFEKTDSVDDFWRISTKLNAEYQIAKVPSGATDLLLFLQSRGYQFIEMNIHLERNLTDIILPTILRKFAAKIFVNEPSEEELETVFSTIKAGVFKTDKVALDPYFGLEKSGRRYYHWIQDELNQNSKCYIIKYNDRPLGFNILKNNDNKEYNALFGALFPDAQAIPGVGVFLPYYNCLKARDSGGTHISTGVSSNNVQALRTNQIIGFEVTEISYILVKHLS